MSQKITTPRATPPNEKSERSMTPTRTLLGCGVLAGPVFVTLALSQAFTRDQFDLSRHPLSLLSLGDLGWIQISNFVVTGLLTGAFSVGVWRALHPGRGGTWGPLLIGAFGIGLVAGGVFVTDPALGFPPGAPSGIPDEASWHGVAHSIAAGVAIDIGLVACLVFVRRFVALRAWGWAAFCGTAGAVGFALSWWPDEDSISVRLAAAAVLILAWASALAVRLRTESREQRVGKDRAE